MAVLVLVGPSTLRAQAGLPDAPDANPGRPTVSTPPTLTPVGYLQFENGGLYATHSPEFSKRFGISQVIKLSINERMELLALFEPFTHSTGGAVSGNRRERFSQECKQSFSQVRRRGQRCPASTLGGCMPALHRS